MSRALTCPKGHSWELPLSPTAGAPNPLRCPTCGLHARPAPGADGPLAAPGQDPGATLEQTLPTPLPLPPRSMIGEARSTGGTASIERTSQPSQLTPTRTRLGAAASSATESAAGYTIIRLHASGGLGCVNLARDEAIQRDVALKQIQPHLADNAHSRQRFVAEAKITGRLEHPGIVPVYTMGADPEGRPYYVMRFVRGRTLDDHINDYFVSPNPLVLRALLRHFVAVCHAIAYAHSRGVIHRDIKPSNIMIGDYGETLVLDWGLAKDLKERPARSSETSSISSVSNGTITSLPVSSSLTQDGQVIGTPAYMAPEQASGRPELHAPPTDIFSLGAVLYKLLTKQAPNTGKSTTSLEPGHYQPPPPPSALQKDVHPGLEAICLKAMAPRPEERYQRAMELADAVLRWLDDTPLTRPKENALRRLMSWVRDNPLSALIYGLLAFAGVLIVIALICMARARP